MTNGMGRIGGRGRVCIEYTSLSLKMYQIGCGKKKRDMLITIILVLIFFNIQI